MTDIQQSHTIETLYISAVITIQNSLLVRVKTRLPKLIVKNNALYLPNAPRSLSSQRNPFPLTSHQRQHAHCRYRGSVNYRDFHLLAKWTAVRSGAKTLSAFYPSVLALRRQIMLLQGDIMAAKGVSNNEVSDPWDRLNASLRIQDIQSVYRPLAGSTRGQAEDFRLSAVRTCNMWKKRVCTKRGCTALYSIWNLK